MKKDKIIIKELSIEHLEHRVQLLNDPLISKGVNTKEVFNINDTLKWYNNRNKHERYDAVFFLADDIIGMGGLVNIIEKSRMAELYIYLDPKYHGKGYGTICTALLAEYGFEKLSLNRIYLYTFTENIAANRMYEKVGFLLEGTLRQHTFHDGKLCDRNIYGLLKSDLE